MGLLTKPLICLLLGAVPAAPNLDLVRELEPGAGLSAAPRTDDVIEVSLQRLADIDYEPGDEIDEEIMALSGRTIRITGYMRTGTVEGVEWFDLINDSCGCGTGKLQHFVRVTMTDDTTRFQPEELELTGKFEVGEKEDEDGFIVSIYRLTIERLDG